MSDKSRVARKGPIKIRLNPNKVITIESWSVGPGQTKHNYKKYKETVSGKRVK
jgi:hypothetical protein